MHRFVHIIRNSYVEYNISLTVVRIVSETTVDMHTFFEHVISVYYGNHSFIRYDISIPFVYGYIASIPDYLSTGVDQ